MPAADSSKTSSSVICVDLGTTNTRVWLVNSQKMVLAHVRAQVGVRDSAREGNSNAIRRTLRSLIDEVLAACSEHRPDRVIAAGMITSALGLLEIPHLRAPAGIAELAAATQAHTFADITELPIYLIPGVRCGPADATGDQIAQTDLMRGEETLCVGLIAQRQIETETTVLNLGSHWKAIQIGIDGRILRSATSLAGELLHAAQTSTILASAMPEHRPSVLDPNWIDLGFRQQKESGLARTLFCVRLLQLRAAASADQLVAYMAGAFIASDMAGLIASGAIRRNSPVLVVGNPAVSQAWAQSLHRESIPASVVSESECEQAMLAGLTAIVPFS